ncbi:hypothetical protein RGUI_1148 [Rhodovulum sp. P5]|uniref:hypothetical protein n=1 Tax=Rhodovulum sp. P5 TaxID=1564506 RepID=UPI0009C20611|nr:hypothetical protein [Rhodovulum sp. P5]ARE39289.1 hypothetical protein RGUI_1148 [Rhodovulum sp. P5]
MLKYIKNVKAEQWPALILRGSALLLIVVHLFTFLFIYQHFIFFITALVLGLLLAREMYEDLAQRFFKLKAEEYEKDLMELQETAHPNGDRALLIEGSPSLKDIAGSKTKH